MSAIISKCGTYRYRLERILGPQPKTCMFIMLNPSTADHEDGKYLGQDRKILAKLKEWGVPLHILKLSKGGHPRHPSRLSAALVPQFWK